MLKIFYEFRELYGADMYVGLSPSRMFLKRCPRRDDGAANGVRAGSTRSRGFTEPTPTRYYLDPGDYGEPEVTEICIGTSWNYLGGLFRP